jgi:hypothetical protein
LTFGKEIVWTNRSGGFASCECATLGQPISKTTATNQMREILFISMPAGVST